MRIAICIASQYIQEEVSDLNRDEYKDLALKWAPINYQFIKLNDTIQNHGREDLPPETKRDLIVPINLDGYTKTCKCGFMKHDHKKPVDKNRKYVLDKSKLQKHACSEFISKYTQPEDAWDTHNRRETLEDTLTENLLPVAYYSIATTTHYFYILYSFYHADDKKHPNDMEGCLVIIQRGKKDRLVGMLTVSHLFFPRYVYKERIQFQSTIFDKRREEIKKAIKEKKMKFDIGNGSLSTRIKNIEQRLKVLGLIGKMEADEENESVRALIQQETEGHGLYALGGKIAWPFSWLRKISQFINKIDIIVYYPSTKAYPYRINDLYRYKGMPHLTSIYYELVDVHSADDFVGFWDLRDSSNVFTKDGSFHGEDAKPPWKWVEKISSTGEEYSLWNNPAELTDLYFDHERDKPFVGTYKKKMKDVEDPDEDKK